MKNATVRDNHFKIVSLSLALSFFLSHVWRIPKWNQSCCCIELQCRWISENKCLVPLFYRTRSRFLFVHPNDRFFSQHFFSNLTYSTVWENKCRSFCCKLNDWIFLFNEMNLSHLMCRCFSLLLLNSFFFFWRIDYEHRLNIEWICVGFNYSVWAVQVV